MICDNSRGKITYEEAMRHNIGFLQYLWYIGLKTNANNKTRELEKSEQLLEDLKV